MNRNWQPPASGTNKSKPDKDNPSEGPNEAMVQRVTSKPDNAYFLVEKKIKENSASTEGAQSMDYYIVKTGDQEEDEKTSLLYMVQWNCCDEKEPGYLPFKKDPEIYLGKKKRDKNKGPIQEGKDDKHKVYCMTKMDPKETEAKEILKSITDTRSNQKREKGDDKNESELKYHDFYLSPKRGRRKRKVGDLQDSYMFMVKMELTSENQRKAISRSLTTNPNQICVYHMVEMEQTEAQRTAILSCIGDNRRNVFDIMKKGIKKIIACIQRAKKEFLNLKEDKMDANYILNFFTIFIILMLAVAVYLFSLSKNKDDNKSCEVDEALQFLKVNFTLQCKYQDVKNSLENIWIISILSFVFDVIWLHLVLMFKLITPKEQIRTFVAIHVFTIALSGLIFGSLLLYRHDEIKDSKTEETYISYSEIKTLMEASLKQQFTSDLILKDDSISDRWNRFFIKYDCCSVHQVTSTTNDFDTTPWCTTSGSCQQTNSQIPKACCKDVTEDDYINAAASCHATVTSGTYKDSCFARVKKLNDEALTEKEVDDFFTGLIIMEASKFLAAFSCIVCICWIIYDKLRGKKKKIPSELL